jgi:hypothetical protein
MGLGDKTIGDDPKPDGAASSTLKPEHNHIRLRWVGCSKYRKYLQISQDRFHSP